VLTPADCSFSQLNDTSPAVTSATIASSSTITVVGTDFPTSGYSAIIVYKDVESSSAVIESGTAITATFDMGVPVGAIATSPSIRFVPSSSRRRLVALADANLQLIATQDTTLTFENALSVTDSQTGLSCSFQGGCPYTITAAGLTATL